MPRQKVEFKNKAGHTLACALELPSKGKLRAMALFAHCFTCGKDVVAASRITGILPVPLLLPTLRIWKPPRRF